MDALDLAALAVDPEHATPEAVAGAVAALETPDPAHVPALAASLAVLMPAHGDSVAEAMTPSVLWAFVRAGCVEIVESVLSAWMRTGAWERVRDVHATLSLDEGLEPARAVRTLVAVVRAQAFVDPRAALATLKASAHALDADPESAARFAEAEAVVRSADDIPSAEGAARRAFACVVVERSWRPEAWGPDHGALVALVKRRTTAASDRYGGPLMRYLERVAPDEMGRIAKRSKAAGGGSGGGGAGPAFWEVWNPPPTGAAAFDRPKRVGYLASEFHAANRWIAEEARGIPTAGRRSSELRGETSLSADAPADAHPSRERTADARRRTMRMDAPRGSGIPKFLIWIPAVIVGMLVLGWLIQILGISGPTWIRF